MRRSKRMVLKGLALGSVWTAPVVESIVLPVHAETTTPQTEMSFSFSFSTGAIPDQASTQFTTDVSLACTSITKVTLELDITHSFLADLDATLSSPVSSQPIFNDLCGQATGVDMLLDDDASNMVPNNAPFIDPLCPGTAVLTGTFNTGGGLNAFNGEDPNGQWILEITDDTGFDSGLLNSATLNINCLV